MIEQNPQEKVKTSARYRSWNRSLHGMSAQFVECVTVYNKHIWINGCNLSRATGIPRICALTPWNERFHDLGVAYMLQGRSAIRVGAPTLGNHRTRHFPRVGAPTLTFQGRRAYPREPAPTRETAQGGGGGGVQVPHPHSTSHSFTLYSFLFQDITVLKHFFI